MRLAMMYLGVRKLPRGQKVTMRLAMGYLGITRLP